MAKPIALHVVVLHFAHALDAKRLPRQVFAGAPAALASRHAIQFAPRLRPLAPWVVVERALSERRELAHELLARGHRKRRRDADVLKRAFLVVKPEEQRAHARAGPILVPAKSCDDAVGRSRVFHFDHRALARLVDTVLRFRHHAIKTRAFEPREPVRGRFGVARHRRQIDRWCHPAEKRFEPGPPLAQRRRAKVVSAVGEQIECDERCGRCGRKLGDARCRGMQPHLQRVEIEAMRRGDDDLAVEHTLGQRRQQCVVQIRKVAIERPQVAALDEEVRWPAKHDCAKAVPFRFVQEAIAGGQLLGELCQHRLDRRLNGKRGHKRSYPAVFFGNLVARNARPRVLSAS